MNNEENTDLASGTFLEHWPNWIRWLLFLPASIVVPILFLIFQSLMQTWFLDIGPDAFYLVLMRGVIYGYGFVVVGSFVVPKYQKVIALFLMILVAMLMGVGLFSVYITQSSLTSVAEAIIILISAGFATYQVFHDFN